MVLAQFQDAPWRYTMMSSEGFLAHPPDAPASNVRVEDEGLTMGVTTTGTMLPVDGGPQ